MSIVKTWFAENNLVFATVTEMVGRTVVWIRIEPRDIRRALNGAKVLFEHCDGLSTAKLIVSIAIAAVGANLVWIESGLFDKQTRALK